MVGDTGLEPVTSCVSSRRSSQSELIALIQDPLGYPRRRTSQPLFALQARARQHRVQRHEADGGQDVAADDAVGEIRGLVVGHQAQDGAPVMRRISSGAVISATSSVSGFVAVDDDARHAAGPAPRAASTVRTVWLIVPRPGRATMTSGRPNPRARSATNTSGVIGHRMPPIPSTSMTSCDAARRRQVDQTASRSSVWRGPGRGHRGGQRLGQADGRDVGQRVQHVGRLGQELRVLRHQALPPPHAPGGHRFHDAHVDALLAQHRRQRRRSRWSCPRRCRCP